MNPVLWNSFWLAKLYAKEQYTAARMTADHLDVEVMKHIPFVSVGGLCAIIPRQTLTHLVCEVIECRKQVRRLRRSFLKARNRAGDGIDIDANYVGSQTQRFDHRRAPADKGIKYCFSPAVHAFVIRLPEIGCRG